MFILIDSETEQRVNNVFRLENSKIYRLEILAFPRVSKYKREKNKLETAVKRPYDIKIKEDEDNETNKRKRGNRDNESQNEKRTTMDVITEKVLLSPSSSSSSSVFVLSPPPPRRRLMTCETKNRKNPWQTLRNATRLVGEYYYSQPQQQHDAQSFTDEVINLLTKQLGWCTLADIEYRKNIYCPLHENPKTSKTPSAVLYTSTHTFKCFSSRCRVSTRISTKQLLDMLRR